MINLATLEETLSSQLFRLNRLPVGEETLKHEIARSQAMANLAGKIIDCAELALKACELSAKGAEPSRNLSFEPLKVEQK